MPTPGVTAYAAVLYLRAAMQLPERVTRDRACSALLWRRSMRIASGGGTTPPLTIVSAVRS